MCWSKTHFKARSVRKPIIKSMAGEYVYFAWQQVQWTKNAQFAKEKHYFIFFDELFNQ